MKFDLTLGTLAAGMLAAAGNAHAHGYAGDHLFISTLLIDDANVADEASFPTFSYLPQPSDTNPPPQLKTFGFEFDKRITENFGFAINGGYNWLTRPGDKTANGWSNFVGTLKYKPYVSAEHEFLFSVGVQRVFARSGANGTNGGCWATMIPARPSRPSTSPRDLAMSRLASSGLSPSPASLATRSPTRS